MNDPAQGPAYHRAAHESASCVRSLPMVAFPCPKCGATLRAPAEKAGAQSKCPKCGCPVQVPAPLQRSAAADDEILEMLPLEEQPPPEELRRRWHYSCGDCRVGPVSDSEVNQAIARGELRCTAIVWHHGLADWEPASKHFTFPPDPKQAPDPKRVRYNPKSHAFTGSLSY